METKYNGWLISDSFFKRCFAIVGHYFIGSLILGGSFLILLFLFSIIFGGFI